jgi:hypothetical protein
MSSAASKAELQIELLQVVPRGGIIVGVDDGDRLPRPVAYDRTEHHLIDAVGVAHLRRGQGVGRRRGAGGADVADDDAGGRKGNLILQGGRAEDFLRRLAAQENAVFKPLEARGAPRAGGAVAIAHGRCSRKPPSDCRGERSHACRQYGLIRHNLYHTTKHAESQENGAF